jgi:hypothetical protein
MCIVKTEDTVYQCVSLRQKIQYIHQRVALGFRRANKRVCSLRSEINVSLSRLSTVFPSMTCKAKTEQQIRWGEKKTTRCYTMVFIETVFLSTCFGHYYAHHQELETIQMVPAYGSSPRLLLVAGLVHGRRLCVRVQQHPFTRTHNLRPCTRPATSHTLGEVPYAGTICIVSSSWWWV